MSEEFRANRRNAITAALTERVARLIAFSAVVSVGDPDRRPLPQPARPFALDRDARDIAFYIVGSTVPAGSRRRREQPRRAGFAAVKRAARAGSQIVDVLEPPFLDRDLAFPVHASDLLDGCCWSRVQTGL
jgi:hypothetical protein